MGRLRTIGVMLVVVVASVGGSSLAAAVTTTVRASVSSSETQATNHSYYTYPSGNGRHVVFFSDAEDLVAGDTNGVTDLFLRDLDAGTTERVNLTNSGGQTDGPAFVGNSLWGTVSGDGRYVVFASTAANLGVAPGSFQVFVRDRQASTTTQVSVPSNGFVFDRASDASISADGSVVAFRGAAATATGDFFVRDLTANTTQAIPVNGTNGSLRLSSGGRYVAFRCDGNCVAGDTNTSSDIHVYDRTTQTTEIASLGSTGAAPVESVGGDFTISPSGRYLVFSTSDPDLVPGDTNNTQDVFVRDLVADTTERVSVSSAETEGTTLFGASVGATAVSADGRYVFFNSTLDGLTPQHPDGSGDIDIYVRDRQLGTTTLVGLTASGTRMGDSNLGGVSDDATVLTYYSGDAGVPDDTNGFQDAYARNPLATATPGGPTPIVPDPPAPPEQAVWHWGAVPPPMSGSRLVATKLDSLPVIASLAGASTHALFAASDGTVRAWGINAYGQLGDGTTIDRATPVAVSGLSSVVAVSGGYFHSLALRSDGTVWAWGRNQYGQLGIGTTQQRLSPVEVPGLTSVVAVASGYGHNLALRSNGTVWAWGYNASGQLGTGTTEQQVSPVEVPGLTSVVAVTAGSSHSLALRSDGTVWAWGYNGSGGLGDGTTTQRLSAVQVTGRLTEVTGISAGGSHSLAVRADGTVWSWGWNDYGQLGDRTTTTRLSPVQVSGLAGVAAVSAGAYHSLALRSDGTVWAWGENSEGAVGDGTGVRRLTPVAAVGLTGVSKLAAGGGSSLAIGTASPSNGRESGSATVAAGGSVSSDVEGDGATADDPVEVSVLTPTGGTITIRKLPGVSATGSTPGMNGTGRTVEIDAPAATAADPLVITFRVDASLYSRFWDVAWSSVERDGSIIRQSCSGAGASPDPCIASRTRLANGNLEIVVRSSHASKWVVGVEAPIARAGGPYTVAEGSSATLDARASSGAAPLSFAWTPDPQLASPSSSRPIFKGLEDGTFPLTLRVTDRRGISARVDTTITVTNRPPVLSQIAVGKNEKRRLEVGVAFADPGQLDTHTATINWGDGSQTTALLAERKGAGVAGGAHNYQRTGTYTITITVRDDDGGSAVKSLSVSARN